jgi:hypothetical protein
MKRMRKLQFPGNCKRDYNCSLSTYFRAKIIICKLCIKRLFRRCKVAYKNSKFTLPVVLLWAIFGLLTYFWGNSIGKTCSLVDVLWDNKADFFTSVLITAFISIASGFEKRHNCLIHQHDIYCRMMGDFSDFTKEIFKILTKKDDYDRVPFWPLYEKNSFSLICSELKQLNHYYLSSDDIHNLCLCVKNTQRRLSVFAGENFNEMIVDNLLGDNLYDLIKSLDCFDSDMSPNSNDKKLQDKLRSVIEKMYKIIESIRAPWRKDIDYKILFLQLLYSDDNLMDLSYYDEALLNIVDYEFYRNCSDKDYLLRRLFEYSQNKDRSHRKEAVCKIEIPLDEYERIMNYQIDK